MKKIVAFAAFFAATAAMGQPGFSQGLTGAPASPILIGNQAGASPGIIQPPQIPPEDVINPPQYNHEIHSAKLQTPTEQQILNAEKLAKSSSVWSDNRGIWRVEFPSGLPCMLNSSGKSGQENCF